MSFAGLGVSNFSSIEKEVHLARIRDPEIGSAILLVIGILPVMCFGPGRLAVYLIEETLAVLFATAVVLIVLSLFVLTSLLCWQGARLIFLQLRARTLRLRPRCGADQDAIAPPAVRN